MKSSFLSWLLAHLVYCLASTISQRGAVKWDSVGKTITHTQLCIMHFTNSRKNNKAVANDGDSKVEYYSMCV